MVFQSLEVGGVYVSGDIHAIKAGGIKLLDGRVALTDGGGQVGNTTTTTTTNRENTTDIGDLSIQETATVQGNAKKYLTNTTTTDLGILSHNVQRTSTL